MMKVLAAICIFICAALAEDVDYHDTLDDAYDMTVPTTDEIREMIQCLNDRGPCTELVASYKKHYPAVVEEACGRCNPVQKHTAHVFFERVRSELPEEFKIFLQLNDPEGKYYDAFYNAYKDF